ncbi:filamentous haemagglutinin family protein [Telmatospirillum siberiense]|uniref:Filamentous haemagglutinin FhaB/tRNA nuclease CdiA-like TPS domain-containing protein n=1 Tax=Telmatospirillum siberiense TaxID=382514 RepID=A0A2N3PM97_9PROT|nr:filamentous haemagglutinin family protein [Telmatospirillum siberiense]PKU21539.1 hypothetical protein CWS72_26255 [Telmatospirillum siberiense]
MTHAPASRHSLSTSSGAHRRLLLAGVSLVALLAAGPAFASNRLQASTTTATSGSTTGTTGTTGSSSSTTSTSTTSGDLVKTAHSFQAALSAQAAAARAAMNAASNSVTLTDGTNVTVTDGLSANGLVVDPRVTFSGTTSTTTGLWSNISAPVQTTSDGKTTVTLTQSSAQAVATWYKFNVGRNTTVYFDQSAGNTSNGNSWTVLNRIDATGTPSVILGTIKAEGTVLVINPNGIVFGAGSQVNVHTLIASSLDINSYSGTNYGVNNSTGSYTSYNLTVDGAVYDFLAPANETSGNKAFLDSGLYANGYSSTTGSGTLVLSANGNAGTNYGITVEKGATISTLDYVSGYDNGGTVALVGTSVTNQGLIETSAGQIILASGASVLLTSPITVSSSTTSTTTNFTATNLTTQSLYYTPAAISGGAITINGADGVLYSERGNITLMGDSVSQLGVAEATTSITRPGSITITATGTPTTANPDLGLVLFGTDSTTAIVSAENGETIVESSIASGFTAPSITILTNNMDMESGSLIVAPSATMTVDNYSGATNTTGTTLDPSGRVLLESGSVIDLGGMAATASVGDYLYTFKVTANDVADTPLAQSLIGQTVTIDLRLSGTRSDGETWVGSPLFAATGAGYLGNVAYSLDMLLTGAGSLKIGSGGAFTDVLTASGSTVNVSGGAITYGGAMVTTTNVKTAYGAIVNIGSANPFTEIVGLPGTTSVTSDRWNVTTTYSNRMIPTTSSYYDGGYTDGLSAGSISVAAVNPILEGSIIADIVTGSRQASLSVTSSAASLTTPDDLPTGAALTITLKSSNPGNNVGSDVVVLDGTATDVLGGDFALSSTLSLPTTSLGGQTLSVLTYGTDALTAANLGSITITGASALSMTQGASLAVRAGGSITLTGVSEIDGTLTAHGGKITLTGFVPTSLYSEPLYTGAVTIGSSALIDVSGLWVNDSGLDSTTMQGSAWINGGSVILQTDMVSTNAALLNSTTVTAEDATQSIVVAAGSVIDLSSGGYVTTAGKLKTGSDGLPSGNGGSLSLITYAASSLINRWSSDTVTSGSFLGGNFYAPTTADTATVTFAGTLYAGGLNTGGTFTLQAPSVVIDGAATTVSTNSGSGTVTLPTSFFTQGFSKYDLRSTYGGVTVTDDTTLTLKQPNYLITGATTLPATGAALRDFAGLGYALDGLRQAVDLTLIQQAFAFGTDATSTSAGIAIGRGAAIVADPLAAITLSANGAITVLGSITAPGGTITLTSQDATLASSGYGANGTYLAAQDVWIGADAVLDVSGTYVPDPTETAYSTGKVLDGGTITISGNDIVVLSGATLDISGAGATIQLPTGGTTGLTRYATRQIWSDGGTITLGGNSVYFAGAIEAGGGASFASGGTLNVTAGNISGSYGTILIAQSGDVTSGLSSSSAPTTAAELTALGLASGTTFITADTINTSHSGLDSAALTGTTIAFAGDVAIKVPDALYLNGNIMLLPAGATGTAAATSTVATTVTLDAGYIRWLSGTEAVPASGGGTLNLNASAQIDLAGVVSAAYTDTVNLTVSDGDIRFLPASDTDIAGYLTAITYGAGTDSSLSSSSGALPSAGALIVSGDLTMTAREIYPATDTAFLLMSLAADGTIAFKSNGQSTITPISAGGAILVDAANIKQAGALYAPLGTIQLGFSGDQTLPAFLIGSNADTGTNAYDPVSTSSTSGFTGILNSILTALKTATGSNSATIVTDSVTLASGSVTSTSANGTYIPYGTTTDGTDWTVSGTLLSGPSSKLIVLAGKSVTTASGATIDESGGGDVYATEFVAGTGGSRNVLTASIVVNGTTEAVYALVPSYEAKVAAYDTTTGTTVALGSAVTLTGGNGIAAGTYVLMPAEYATLAGAYRVVVVSTNTGSTATTSRVAADGSIYTTGTLTNAITGAKSSSTALFEIQSNSTWTRYSEIDINYGDAYFTALAATNGTAVPRLAEDAGQMIIAAATRLSLGATNDFTAASGGRGGEVDITGADLLVTVDPNSVDTTSGTYAGYIAIGADQINALDVESVLIGGYRTTSNAGVVVTTTAKTVEVETDAAHPLSGPEILLAALGASSGGSGLTIDQGSVIKSSGTVSSSDAIVLSGDGAFVRVSNGGAVTVTRSGATAYDGVLSILSGAILSGTSIALNSSGNVTIDDSATLTARNYDLGAQLINVGGGTSGLVLSEAVIAQMAGADTVLLRGLAGITFYDGVALGTSANPIGTLTLDAPVLTAENGTANASVTATDILLKNTSATTGTAAGGSGRLTLDALGTLTFGKGTKVTSGFGAIAASAGTEILFSGTGSLDAGSANISLTAPFLVVDTSASQSLTTKGTLTILPGANGTLALSASVYGGSLSLTGGSIADSGTIIAQSGKVTLEATTGDLALSGNAAIKAAGTEVILSDQAEDTPGGTVKLIADLGNITLGSGTTIDVSAAGVGYGGTVGISAAKGTATLDGTLTGAASSNALGGTFLLSANALAGSLPLSAFTGEFEVALTTGDIAIATGQTLTAATVLLEADGGFVTVNGTIDASGTAGGTISLYGTKGVDVEGSLLARGSSATELGGTVEIGTSGIATAGSYNGTYGYENVAAANSGVITIGSGAVIDVSGGTSEGLTGGTILIRAPLLDDGSVNVRITPGATFIGSRATTLEAYAVWSTSDSTTGTKHFDAIIDPAGWYSSGGTLLAGGFVDGSGTTVASWNGSSLTASSTLTSTGTASSSTDSSGNVTKTTTAYQWDGATLTTTVTATTRSGGSVTSITTTITTVATDGTTTTIATTRDGSGNVIGTPTTKVTSGDYNSAVETYLLTYYYFTPTAANSDHQTFYGYVNGTEASGAGTLMKFVQSPGFAAVANTSGIANFAEVAGIELRNPSASVNSGNISVLTNWNLGAEDSSGGLLYRTTATGKAPILTLRAENNIDIKASITDGFTSSSTVTIGSSIMGTYADASNAYNSEYSTADSIIGNINSGGLGGLSFDSAAAIITSPVITGSSSDYYYYLYSSYSNSYIKLYAYYVGDVLSVGYNGGYYAGGGDTLESSSNSYYQSLADVARSYLSTANIYYNKISTDSTSYEKLSDYQKYLDNYNSYITSYYSWMQADVNSLSTLPVAPKAVPAVSVTAGTTVTVLGDTSPSPAAKSSNYSPISSMDLAGEASSTSYRIVAGANFTSANPLAVDSTTSADVVIDDHISYTNPQYSSSNGLTQTISVGTVVRTGTGSIDIAASGDFVLADTVAPGAVYTAGTAVDTGTISDFTAVTLTSAYSSNPNGLVSTPTWATGGGSVTVTVGGDMVGVESATLYGAESWASWYYHAMATNGTSTPFSSSGDVQTQAWVNYATYGDGIGALGGGNVTLKAGGTIKDIIVSLPETLLVSGGTSSTPSETEHTYGGGNLTVTAGNMVGSAFLVGDGTGVIRINGSVTTDGAGNALELAVQNGVIGVVSDGAITLSGIYDPATLSNYAAATAYTPVAALPGTTALGTDQTGYFTSYSADSGVSLTSVSGDVTITVAASGNALMPHTVAGTTYSTILAPASLTIDAIGGDIVTSGSYSSGAGIDLIPSSSGSLTLLAGGSIDLINSGGVNYTITMLDGTYSASNPYISPLGTKLPTTLSTALHADDDGSVIIYAGGDLKGTYSVIKQAKLYAGNDMVNVGFTGQNNSPADITSIIAGRDILAKVVAYNSGVPLDAVSTLLLYGPGDFLVQAGRNLGPFTTFTAKRIAQNSSLNDGGGIFTVGDGSNCTSAVCGGTVRSYLPVAGADLTVLYGVGAGVDYADFINDYVNPTNALAKGFLSLFTVTVDGLTIDLTSDAGWTWFQAQSTDRQHLLVDKGFSSLLTAVATDYSNSSSAYYQQYARAYQAIATLFPASLGYTDNSNAGGSNGASTTVTTGTMRMAHSLVETQTGGTINILGPGGSLYVGSNSDDSLSPSQQGILTLQGGSVNIYTDRNVMVYQSRIFTEQGGDVDIFSANGDINAGKGKKSKTSYPKLKLVCDTGGYCRVSPVGLVSGAGIGALVTVPGQDADDSNMTLSAPHGTVDAGAAGIRVAGNLNIVALHVLNAFNISAGGTATGVPVAVAPTVNLGALSASAAAGTDAAAADAASRSSRQTGPRATDLPSIITIEVIGYGGGATDEPGQPQEDRNRRARDRQSRYDAADPVRVVGYGPLTPTEVSGLTEEERRKLAQP